MVNKLLQRILENKVQKGFPIRDYQYDFKKLEEEIEEAQLALADKDFEAFGEELADIIILVLGMASYEHINMEKHLFRKMDKIEKRKIIKVAENKFEKEEGH